MDIEFEYIEYEFDRIVFAITDADNHIDTVE